MKIRGFPVHDANSDAVLHIRDGDTKNGKKDPANCAAAKAACRLPGAKEALVYRSRSFVLFEAASGKKWWRRYLTSPGIRDEIISFDRGGGFDPGDYELIAPKGTQRLRAMAKRKRDTSGPRPRRTNRSPHVIKGVRDRLTEFSHGD